MAGAKAIRFDRIDSYPLCAERVGLREGEGGVHLVIMRDGWPGGSETLCNFFADETTADQLRRLASAVDLAIGRADGG